MSHSIDINDELRILNPYKTKLEAIQFLFDKFDDKTKSSKYAMYDTIEYILSQDDKVDIDVVSDRMVENLNKYKK
jgi:hypothetical protein